MGRIKLSDEDRAEWVEARDSKEWDDFVSRNGGSVFHLWAWRKVLESDGSKTFCLAYRDPEGEILAVCPFVHEEGKRLRYLESFPDSVPGGPVIGAAVMNPSQAIAKLPRSVRFSLSNPIIAMLINTHRQPVIDSMVSLGFPQRLMRSGFFLLDLQGKTPEHIWTNGFEKHDRQAVKYYEQRAKFEFTSSEDDYLGLERPNWNHFKGRIFRSGFISKMRAWLGDRLKVALVTDASGTAVAGFLMLLDPPGSLNSSVHLLAIRHNAMRNIHSPVTFINWKAINWAHEHGFRYVDFGPYPIKNSMDPTHMFYKLREKYQITLAPTYQFTLPISNAYYSMAKGVGRILGWKNRFLRPGRSGGA